MRSPAIHSTAAAAADNHTSGTWTPTILSPSSPAIKSYTLSSASAFPLSSGAVSASATASVTNDGGGGGGDRSALETAVSGPAEENAVRNALGLPPTGAAESGDNHVRASNHRHSSDVGLSGDGREGGGSGGLDQTSQGPGGAPLCLLLSNLGELFRWDVAAAADICADAFPGVRPW